MKEAGAERQSGPRTERLTVNGRGYARPARPVVVVCIDGSEAACHERAIADGRMPFLERMLRDGSELRADCTMPSFTNPNNLSIATGVPPAVHGICGGVRDQRAGPLQAADAAHGRAAGRPAAGADAVRRADAVALRGVR
ncbi:alkaline phosphatase family protein [Streptomyces niger]|uniref:alkaline phosphatase family protein n=1 Tax=Streptomyces niger TaxID=66373 RepID=UPI000B08B538|nr:alkaline phosphatase family protein [Streptomyces niger]